jgi:type I restriction enzyme S subunit
MELKELCKGGGSYGIAASSVPYSSDLPTYLRITDIKDDGTIDFDGLKSVDDPNAPKYFLSPNDIVFARTGASTGRNYFYDGSDGEFVYAGFLIKFSIDSEKVNPLYIKYFCQSDEYKNWVQSFNTGSTRGNINAQTFGDMPIELPPREQQDLLAATLSALDARIAENRAINHHLEQMAQAIFKSWFVDFEPWGGVMPEDWREGTLSEIANITMGQSPDGKSYNKDGIGTVFYQGGAEFSSRFPTRRLFTTKPKRMAAKGGVLMSVRAPVGDLNVAYESCCIGRGLAAIQSNDDAQSFILYTMFALKQTFDIFNGEGTVFGSINKNDMANLPVLIPTDEAIRQFEELVRPMDATIEANYAESCHLQAARDSLLPRLMSGELSVADVDVLPVRQTGK